jgi:hypothetical protein
MEILSIPQHSDFREGEPDSIGHTIVGIHNLVERAAKDKKERRKRGLLSPTLRESLRACNVLQLKNVRKLCQQYVQDQRNPPEPFECGEHFTEEVLVSVSLKNKRYQLEIRNRKAKEPGKQYLNGPYLYAYHRDGKYIRQEYFKKVEWKKLPRKVLSAIKPFLNPSAVQQYYERIMSEYASGQRPRS